MQIKDLRIKSYGNLRINQRKISEEAQRRLSILKKYELLKEDNCSLKVALETLEISRATLYRWKRNYKRYDIYSLEPLSKRPQNLRKPKWTRAEEKHVLQLRSQYPLWGKKTIRHILVRDHKLDISESSVGRILRKLVEQNKVLPVSFYYGRMNSPKKRKFAGHAKRWESFMKTQKAGEMIQVDHMSVDVAEEFPVKHFEAICPLTKILVSKSYTNATSSTSSEFLEYIQKSFPFEIKSIQVDGGSEFMKDFERTCYKESIPLYVIPPRSPEINGCVERVNKTLRYEFYQLYDGRLDMKFINKSLSHYNYLYNHYRPHQSLHLMTPMEYHNNSLKEAS